MISIQGCAQICGRLGETNIKSLGYNASSNQMIPPVQGEFISYLAFPLSMAGLVNESASVTHLTSLFLHEAGEGV